MSGGEGGFGGREVEGDAGVTEEVGELMGEGYHAGAGAGLADQEEFGSVLHVSVAEAADADGVFWEPDGDLPVAGVAVGVVASLSHAPGDFFDGGGFDDELMKREAEEGEIEFEGGFGCQLEVMMQCEVREEIDGELAQSEFAEESAEHRGDEEQPEGGGDE